MRQRHPGKGAKQPERIGSSQPQALETQRTAAQRREFEPDLDFLLRCCHWDGGLFDCRQPEYMCGPPCADAKRAEFLLLRELRRAPVMERGSRISQLFHEHQAILVFGSEILNEDGIGERKTDRAETRQQPRGRKRGAKPPTESCRYQQQAKQQRKRLIGYIVFAVRAHHSAGNQRA